MNIRKLAAQPATRRTRWYLRLLDTLIEVGSSGASPGLSRISLPTGSIPTEELLSLIQSDVAGTAHAERCADRLMKLLTGAGDRASIVRAADALKHAIREDFGLQHADAAEVCDAP